MICVQSAAILLVLSYTAFIFNWQITLVILLTIPMQAYVMHVEFPVIGDAAVATDERLKLFMSTAQEAIEKILAARLIHISAFMRDRVTSRGADLKVSSRVLKLAQLKINYRISVVETLGVMAVVMMGALYLRGGRLASLGQVLAMYRIAQKMTNKTGKLIEQFRCFRMTSQPLAAVCGIINERGPAPSENGATSLPNYDVEFKGVKFRYGDRDGKNVGDADGDAGGAAGTKRDVLCGVDMLVKEGTKVVLMGNSGAGKSTILKVLTQLLEHGSGEITVGGLPFDKVDQSIVYSAQPQASSLFNVSIRDNIRMGAPDSTTDEDVEAAARAASLIGTPDQAINP
jgi:ABC-type multidrug transport system fused ATPase/permease subunit